MDEINPVVAIPVICILWLTVVLIITKERR